MQKPAETLLLIYIKSAPPSTKFQTPNMSRRTLKFIATLWNQSKIYRRSGNKKIKKNNNKNIRWQVDHFPFSRKNK